MEIDQVVAVLHELLLLTLLLVAPTVATSLVVGLAISILQTVTSIQEQTLSFAPRIVAVTVVGGLTLTWSLNLLISFTQRLFALMVDIVT